MFEQLSAENPSVYLPYLATSCHNVGIFYYENTYKDKAEQELLRTKEIYERLTTFAPERYTSNLADACENLGELYENTDRPEQAAAEYARAEELRKQAKTL